MVAPTLDPAEIRRLVAERAGEVLASAEAVAVPDPVNRFRFVSTAEMLAAPAPAKWLICELLTLDSLAVLFGESGGGKSFVALDMAACAAAGIAWQGHKVPGAGPVFYVAGEGFRGLSARLQVLVNHYALDPTKLPLFFASAAVQFLDRAEADAVTAEVHALAEVHGLPRLVVVDTLARNYGGDENDTKQMSAFVAAMDRIKSRFGCAVLVVHHTGLGDKSRSRGNGSLRAGLDWEYRLESQGEAMALSCTKVKDFEPAPSMAFARDVVNTGWTDADTGRQITSCVLRQVDRVPGKGKALPTKQRIAFDTLLDLSASCGGPVHVKEWREATYQRGICLSEDNESKAKAFKRAAGALLDSGHVLVNGDHYRPSTGQTGQTGQTPDMSMPDETGQTGHIPIGMSVLSSRVAV